MPRVVTERFKVYRFEELGDEAKERVKERDMQVWGFHAHEEYVKSFEKLCMRFCAIARCSIDWFGTGVYCCDPGLRCEDMGLSDFLETCDDLGSVNPETGKGMGDCILTGYCADEDAIDGFRTELVKWQKKHAAAVASSFFELELDEDVVSAEDIKVMLEAAFESLVEAGQADCAGYYEDEYFGETCDANEWEFLENGEMYDGRPKQKKQVRKDSGSHPVGAVGIA